MRQRLSREKVMELVRDPKTTKITTEIWFAGNTHTVKITKAEALKMLGDVDERSICRITLVGKELRLW